jgi:hypothetical protein
MVWTVELRVFVEAEDFETAVRKAMYRLREVGSTKVLEDKYADVERSAKPFNSNFDGGDK